MDKQTKIITILRGVAQKPFEPAPDESLFDSGLLDSFALPDLASALEKEFGIHIPDRDLTPTKFDSVERIERYLNSRT